MPVKPNSNGLLTLYTKEEMKTKFKIASPNLYDSTMMNMRYINIIRPQLVMPKPLKTYYGGNNARTR